MMNLRTMSWWLTALMMNTLVAGSLRAQQRITVGPNVQVSAALGGETHFEMIMAADPEHAERLMACSIVSPLAEANTVVETYASFDTGRTWAPTLQTRGHGNHESWDPDCAYGPGGVAYSLSEGIDSLTRTYDRIDRSNDGGRTWAPPALFKHAERSFMSIDRSTGPRRGWMYVHGMGSVCVPGIRCAHGEGTYVIATPDGGRTFTGEQVVPADSGDYLPMPGRGVVLSDGTAIMPVIESTAEWKWNNLPLYNSLGVNRQAPNQVIRVLRLTEARTNWPVTIDQALVDSVHDEDLWNGSWLPNLTADASAGPFRDRLYIVWVDHRFGKLDVLFAYSTDKGKTWSKPRVVNDDHRRTDGNGPDDFQGVVAVNAMGVVGVMWYDRRDQPDDLGWDVRFRASLDGGETFAPSVRLNTVSQRPLAMDAIQLESGHGYYPPIPVSAELGVHSFNFSGGHTAGLAADASGAFHPLWVDNRTGVPQLWTARVTVPGTAAVNGAPDLASLVDASKVVDLRITRPLYHHKTGLVEATVGLENASDGDTVTGPFKVRVLDLRADVGTTTVTNADAGGTGEGAVWDFTSLVSGGRLAPHERSKTKVFTFHLADPDAIRPFGPNAWVALAHFNAKVLAGHLIKAPDTTSRKTQATVSTGSAGAGMHPPRLEVGPNVHVSSGLAGENHSEMILAADPEHAERLMACSMVSPLDLANTVVETYVSQDTGRTWAPTLRTAGYGNHESWDPDCAYGPGGVAYSLSEGIDSLTRAYDRIDRSEDGGRTWGRPALFKHAERSFMSIDFSSGPRHGWMYVHGSGSNCVPGIKCLHGDATRVVATPDGGSTIVGEKEVPADAVGENPFTGRGVVLTDGTAIMPVIEAAAGSQWNNLPLYNSLGVNRQPANGAFWVLRLTEARTNWPLTIDKVRVSDVYSEDQWNGSPLPYATADLSNGPFRDRIYVTWIDHRFGKLDVLFAYSTDKGKTWSKPRVINDDHRRVSGVGPDDLHGIPAVSPTGVVGVMWYDRRNHPDDLGWDVRFRASFDGGETFTPSVQVNTVSNRPLAVDSITLLSGHDYYPPVPVATELGVHSFQFSGGHTAGLAADAAGAFHPLWIDNRTGVPQLWTARIAVTGTVAANGAPDLAPLVDASKVVDLRMTKCLYHHKTGLVEATVALENASDADTVTGPFKVRVLDLRADAGTTTVTNADAGGTGEGAVWDFTAAVPDGRLRPHEQSKTKRFTFHMADPDTIRPFGPNAWVALAHFDAKVLVGNLVVVPDSIAHAHPVPGADPDHNARGADPDDGHH